MEAGGSLALEAQFSQVASCSCVCHHLAFLSLCNGTFGSGTERGVQGSDLHSPREPRLSLPLSLSSSGLGRE